MEAAAKGWVSVLPTQPEAIKGRSDAASPFLRQLLNSLSLAEALMGVVAQQCPDGARWAVDTS